MSKQLPTGGSVGQMIRSNYRLFAASTLGFAFLGFVVFLLIPKSYTATSTLQVPTDPFNFQIIASSRTVAVQIAQDLHVPGGADAVQASTTIEPIVPRFVYVSAYSTLLTITTKSSDAALALAVNTSLINVSFRQFTNLEGKAAAMSLIDKPYVTRSQNGRLLLTDIATGLIIGFFAAYGAVWLRNRR